MEPRPICGPFSFDFHLNLSLRIVLLYFVGGSIIVFCWRVVLLYFVGYQTINDLKINFLSLRLRHTHENTLQIQEYSVMQCECVIT